MTDLKLTRRVNTKIPDEALGTLQLNDDELLDFINAIRDQIAAGVGVTPGTIIYYAGTDDPEGYLLCDHSSYLRADYPALFGKIGTTYGSVDGTHFNVPDGQGRMPVGLGTHSDVDALGDNEGVATVANRTPIHNSTVSPAGSRSSSGFGNAYAPGVAVNGFQTDGGDLSVGPGGTRPVDTSAFITFKCYIKT